MEASSGPGDCERLEPKVEVPLGAHNDAHAQMIFTIILTGRVDVHSEYMSVEARGDSPSGTDLLRSNYR